MSATAASKPASTRRGVGVYAGLTQERIIEAARSLDPDELSMQALARELGVDRKALNHHVSDRETLLALVAMDAFSETFSAVDIGRHASWQDACRAYALGFIRSAIATGSLADHIRLTDSYVTDVLEPTEAVLTKMVAAGFSDEQAMRSLSLLTNISLGYARDAVLRAKSGVAPRAVILRGALERRDRADYPTLSRIADLPVTTYDDHQLHLSINIFVAGAERQLSAAETEGLSSSG
ncbi:MULTISPECIES: TetR/AcrR family transcriptional regulator C-terminal domain-containing protein [unclassified Microbacterium]|uniref:TetR/AcrR family transcriptional regulator C-terminal domain-containing protein n=1 Tax=unclassified Microbacterium TaxID=2609290 RepID=UPI00109CB007|nr:MULTISPECIES: TetR/AcrR family transcriptional regulator C-terminal domain-containing protein [unclassified Microbacterium]